MGVKIEDLPPRLQAQVREQLAGVEKDGKFQISDSRFQNAERKTRKAKTVGRNGKHGPNKTETEYQRIHLRGMDARFEALTFRMANGHRYTPDWVVFTNSGNIECHEVKGGYALGSEQRARLAFDQARVEFPWIVWVWANKSEGSFQKTVFRTE